MKKSICIILAFLLALGCGICLAEGETHEHSWSNWTIVSQPTCTVDGLQRRVCSECKEKEEQKISATGHSWGSWTTVSQPTCTADGLQRRVCSECKEKEEQKISATGHSWGSWTIVNQPTCTVDGLQRRVCSECKEKEEQKISANGHIEQTISAKAATCIETGLTEGKRCSVCGEILTAQETIPAKGHIWDSGKVTGEPTCTKAGVKTFTCTACGTTKTEEIAATGHEWVETERVEPDCVYPGWAEGRYCEICNESEGQETIPALGHTEEIIPGKAATCTESGLTEGKKCSVCGTILIAQEMIPAMGHQYATSRISPTTTSKGYTKHTCTVCGDSYKDNWKDKLATEAPVATPKPTAEPQTGLYGSIVTNVSRDAMIYDCRIDTLPDGALQGEVKDNLLEIIAEAEADGSYALRNLHLTMEMLEQLKADGIEYIRFINGDATLLIPLEMFEGEDVTLIAADVENATGYVITVDPNAVTAENEPGFQVQAVLTTIDDDETDVTSFVYGMMLTVGDETVEVTENTVYTFQ